MAPVYHLGLVALAICGYIVLTITGNDGNPVFVFTAGQLAGAAVQAKTGRPPQV